MWRRVLHVSTALFFSQSLRVGVERGPVNRMLSLEDINEAYARSQNHEIGVARVAKTAAIDAEVSETPPIEAGSQGGVMLRGDMAEFWALTARLVAAMTSAGQQRNERHQHPRPPRRPVSRRPMRCRNGLVAAQIVGGSAASPTTTTAAALTELELGAESAATSANAEPETDIEPPAQASATITPATKNASIATIAEARYDSDVTIVNALLLSAKTPICVADEGDGCDDSNEGAPLERQMEVPSGEESGYRKEADSGKNAESRDRRKDVYMDFEGLVRHVAREDRRAPYCRTGQNRGLIAPRLNGPAGKEKTNVKDLARRPAPSLATRIDDMDNGWSGKAEGWWAKSKGDKATVRGGCMHCHIPSRVRRRRRRNWRKRKAVAHINQVGGEKSLKYGTLVQLCPRRLDRFLETPRC